MGLFDWFTKKYNDPPKKKSVETFTFDVYDSVQITERYRYKVDATSKDVAQEALVRWFFGDSTGIEINQSSGVGHANHKQWTEGIPAWFGRLVSNDYTGEEGKRLRLLDRQALERFAQARGIALKD